MSRAGAAIPPAVKYAATLILLAVVYYAAARLGLRFASIGPSVSLVWPPTGIAFAAIVLLGYRYWPGIFLGAFLANAATPIPLAAAGGIALGNTLEALAAGYLLRRISGSRPHLEDLRHVRILVFQAAPVAALVSAAIGTASLLLAGVLTRTAVPAALAVWWAGDLLGALVVAPVCFTWAIRPRAKDARGILEVALLFLGTVVAAELALGRFGRIRLLGEIEYTYLLFPFVVWAALRFGPRGASLMTLTVSGATVWHAVRGGGPFVAATTVETLFAITCYLGAVAVTGLVLAAAVWWERDRVTRALRQSEEQLRLALDSARMGIWFWSVESNTLTWDETLRRLYGLASDEQVTGYEGFLSRVHPDDRGLVTESVRKALEGGGKLDYEFRIVLPDGKVRWIADQGEVRRGPNGQPAFMTGVCTDVTDRRAAEERLRQSHRMESVGRLAGGVAHETNNQMSVVLGAASFILQRADMPAAVRTDIDYIRRAAERTAAVTSQLLAFSRRQVMRPEILDLNTVVTGWEPVLRRLMGEDCAVTLRLGSDVGPVKADPGQLEQVLLNLALNARDAMPRGGSLTVETFGTDLTEEYARARPGVLIRPGPHTVLAVSDTGHGMDKATLSRTFEPFFTTKGLGQGTGLGLSVVYGIVKQSDGYVWAYSEPGQGTTFKIYLPVTTEGAAPRRISQPVAQPGTGELVLVVEDEAPVRLMAKRALEEAGYQVVEAENGGEALELLAGRDGKIDLLLTDVVMPGIGGRELAARVAEVVPGIPVLFTSGYTDGEILRRGLLEPGAAFIQKPFTPNAIVRMVRRQLEERTA
ncbi:MAG: MASE1 domain-containing protein [Gemmatimonadales bacterium]